ncbi:T9SS type A sorting domain-containing protein [Hymenobacter busanensis]|uniref:T9SS type A sorting domain-containing protein n=1 Tax=Hymenobacter busanensis TaxID=2607656 RepID=A0A7L5A085_9BACT|nr:T9SS type A sorting domain-containing protein [Hymenobacter busanensis]KAA9325517.1 T9SS type A sorting domain-containing protein [Hymenobacter busanensis]QHJ07812.1 T9SS type A sorting domain-containing protein [Hymenobacter busanensis]
MKKTVLALLFAASVAAAHAQTTCPATAPNVVAVGSGTPDKSGFAITANTTWTRNNIYLLNGIVYVNSGVTLTIEPGTIIKGSFANQGALVIRQGGRINAAGTASQPIVFTSEKPAGQRQPGDWGGIIICGNAPTNRTGSPQIEGGTEATYGGTNPLDNSGVLQYVRIEFPGIPFLPGNEINGLTLGGVGAGTTIDHIQVTASGDDSFEWFGGTVNAKYLVALAGTDDDFDTDFGYSGRVQFGIAVRDQSRGDFATNGVSNGFESDNDGTNSAATPQTSAVFSNMSVFLPTTPAPASPFANSAGALIRQNSSQSIFNSVFAGRRAGLEINGGAPGTTQANATAGTLLFQNNVLAGYSPRAARLGGTSAATPAFNINAFVGGNGNDTTRTLAALGLNYDNLFFEGNCGNNRQCAPNFALPAASLLNTGAAFTNAKVTGTGNGGVNGTFDVVTFRGAFGNTNWTEGWTNFNPQTTCYNVPGQVLATQPASKALQGLSVAPNPTAGAATLRFELQRAGAVSVRVLDVTGREVAVVRQNQQAAAGQQEIALPATLKSGLYIATVSAGADVLTVRFVVSQ